METPAPSPDDLVGKLIGGGRYRIEKALKRGGMGQVYAGVDEVDPEHKRVAIEVVRQSLLEDPQALARFKREARLVTELKHDNIVASLAAGEDAGLLWIAMELLEGESLRERLDARGRMSWQETLPIIEQVVRALQVAHDKGVIHRDLKPENIMLVAEKAKLLDFGVAKQAHVEGQSGTSNMTGTGLIVGTPGYVAPEVVLEGRTDDPRSDFYALGVTWFEMLTAQKPFTAKTAFALAMRHAHEPAPTPTSLVPYSPVPTPIERLVLRLMAKNPDERPQNAVSLLDNLKNLAEESQRALTNPTPPPQSLEAHQNTMTATDLTKANTGVVPFKTPMPSSQTPSTALQPGMTPQPADVRELVPQLLALVPKKKVAAAAAAVFVALVLAVSVTVIVLTALAKREGLPVGAAPPIASVTPPHVPAVAPPVIAPPVVAPVPVPPVVVEPPVVATTTPGASPEVKVIAHQKQRLAGMEVALQKAEGAKERAAGVGEVVLQGDPLDGAWLVGVDNGELFEAPHPFKDLGVGTHSAHFVSRKLGKDVRKPIEIGLGFNKKVNGP